jgi:multisubunit Na+/H+ antiporter MnhF subunit
MTRVRRAIVSLFRDEAIIEIAIGVALAYAVVQVAITAGSMITGPYWNTLVVVREGLGMALVLAAALLLRRQLTPSRAETTHEVSK